MLDACCEMMRANGRDYCEGVPETDLPDALFEWHRDIGAVMLLTRSGQFDCFIQFCPWCGEQIGKHPHDLASGRITVRPPDLGFPGGEVRLPPKPTS